MDALRTRLAKTLARMPSKEPVLIAFHAAYAVCSEEEHLGEFEMGRYTLPSITCALEKALQDRTTRQLLPPNVEARLGTPLPTEFQKNLAAAGAKVADKFLVAFQRMAEPLDPSSDEDMKKLVRECMWNYVRRAANTDVF